MSCGASQIPRAPIRLPDLSFFKPRKDSLFALLSRSPWWLSLAIAAGLFALAQMFLPLAASLAAGAPFLAIAAYAAWRQIKVPSPARVEGVLARLRALTWEEFAALIEQAYRRQGYEIAALESAAADYELRKEARLSIVCCRRWRVAQTGIAPLRELLKAKQARAAYECIYVAAGEFSANAKDFAAKNGVRLLYGAELVKLLGRLVPR